MLIVGADSKVMAVFDRSWKYNGASATAAHGEADLGSARDID
jgi:hypothetical protein